MKKLITYLLVHLDVPGEWEGDWSSRWFEDGWEFDRIVKYKDDVILPYLDMCLITLVQLKWP